MSGAAFQPGPWAASEMTMDAASWESLRADQSLHIVQANWDGFTGDVVACVWCDDDHDEAATARLIAAAPELFEALETARQFVDPRYFPGTAPAALEKIDAALALARGETE